MAAGAAATTTQSESVLGTCNGKQSDISYDNLPCITIIRFGNPGFIAGYSALSGRSGNAQPLHLSISDSSIMVVGLYIYIRVTTMTV